MYLFTISKGGNISTKGISRSNYNSLVASIIFFIILFIPFRPFDKFVAVSIWGATFLMFLLLDDKYIREVARAFSNFIFYVGLFVILVWLLLFLGFTLPFWEYNTGLIGVSKSTFLVYPGTAVLKGQDFDLFGRSVYRMSGVFSEPGHYGIVCFFAYLMSSQLSRFKSAIIVISSLLSFSMGTFILWGGYILIADRFAFKRKVGLVIIIFFLVFIGYMYLPHEVLDRFIFDKIGSDATLDNRTDGNFVAFFQKEHDIMQHLLGYGRLVFDEFSLSNSDYRGFYLRYGILGFVAYLFWVLALNLNGRKKNILLLFFLALVILAHRAWLIDYFILYFILFFVSKSEKL